MTAPCPYHRPGTPCSHEFRCPVLQYPEPGITCTTLTPAQIAMVQAWVAGKALTREEAEGVRES